MTPDSDPCTFNQELEKSFHRIKSSSSERNDSPTLKAIGLNPVREDSLSTECLVVNYNFGENFAQFWRTFVNL